MQADVWSVTSWNELRRDGLDSDKHNFMNPDGEQRVPYVTRKLEGAPGPFVAVSDFMRAVQDQILPWVPGDFASLGTDGWGLSDTRSALRRHFQVDAASIAVRTLGSLAAAGRGQARGDARGDRALPPRRRERRPGGRGGRRRRVVSRAR